jgi:nitronate monooxygenase
VSALASGYAGVQLGTRFIATTECTAHDDYKRAILGAKSDDIVLTDKISGVPVAVIKTPYIERVGTKAGFVAAQMLRHPKLKHWARAYYSAKSVWQLKSASQKGANYRDYFQAGKSVDAIDEVEAASAIVQRFAGAWNEAQNASAHLPAPRSLG